VARKTLIDKRRLRRPRTSPTSNATARLDIVARTAAKRTTGRSISTRRGPAPGAKITLPKSRSVELNPATGYSSTVWAAKGLIKISIQRFRRGRAASNRNAKGS